jgi:hypothetical protein
MTKSVHPRSEEEVGTIDSYCAAPHSLQVWHTGWEIVVAAADSYCVWKSQGTTAAHSLFEIAVGATVSIWRLKQATSAAHERSDVTVATDASYSVAG